MSNQCVIRGFCHGRVSVDIGHYRSHHCAYSKTVFGFVPRRPYPDTAMRELIRRFFEKIEPDDSGTLDAEHDVRVATCALLLEMGHIDEHFTDAEMRQILAILQERYGLDAAQIDALVAEAELERQQSADYWKFARRINENYSIDEKKDIIEMLWRIVYVDGKMDKYEHQLIHTLSNLLRLTHKQLMDAKLKVTTDSA